jgi:hypothetical protein
LQPEVTLAELEWMANAESDTQAARKMQEAKQRSYLPDCGTRGAHEARSKLRCHTFFDAARNSGAR